MEAKKAEILVGIDSGWEKHDCCCVRPDGKVLVEFTVPHRGEDLNALGARLEKLAGGDPGAVAVGIETPHGAVVETLLERGIAVYSLNPKQLDRFRDRHTVAGAKDDRRDAYVLADSLRTDRHLFAPVLLDNAEVIRLRELVRMDEELDEDRNRYDNRLRELLLRYYPQVLKLFSSSSDPFLWDLLDLAPTPEKGRRLRLSTIRNLLVRHRIRRFTAEEVQSILRETNVHVAPGTVEAASKHVRMLVARLRLTQQQTRTCTREIEALLANLRSLEPSPEVLPEPSPSSAPRETSHNRPSDVEILRSLPGVGQVVLAGLIANAAQALARRDYNQLRAQGGIAPVTRQSGKRANVIMRRACHGRLRNAFYHWARTAVLNDLRCKQHYARLRSIGHSHGRALRGVMDRLLPVAIAMLQTGTLYDPNRRSAVSTAA